MAGTSSQANISTRLRQIAKLSRDNPTMVLLTLAHHIDEQFLHEAYRRTRKSGASGVDGQTAEEYAADLDNNLAKLLEAFKRGTYRAPPVKRTEIPKGDGKTRPIGIPTFEDKVLQRAVSMVLEAIYEEDFKEFSYGFRRGRSPHQAVRRLRDDIVEMKGGYVLVADISDCFGSLSHRVLRIILDLRVRDGVIRRVLHKWLKAGVMEGDNVWYPKKGSPQGGVVSPILANIYLHEVLDKWFDEVVRPRLSSEARMVRYADDFMIIFREKRDAQRVMQVLYKRFAKYELTIHPEKTRLVEFLRPRLKDNRGRNSVDFLGFTHYWGKSRKKKWIVKQKTSKKRLSRAIKRMESWCRKNRHQKVKDQHAYISVSIVGHMNYYGVTGNIASLKNFIQEVRRVWRKWLNRRNRENSMPWWRFDRLLHRYPLPKARIAHSIYGKTLSLPFVANPFS
jgi:group II intron reverse transcriptase/maturase